MENTEIYIDDNSPVKVDLKKIISLVMPFNSTIWINCNTPITRKEIKKALENNKLQSPNKSIKHSGLWDMSTREEHINRIAWFVNNLDINVPINIDYGCGNLGGRFEIYDGNHRLLAAYYRKEKYILANCSGLVSLIEKFTFTEN